MLHQIKEQWTGLTLCTASATYHVTDLAIYFINSGVTLTPFTEATVSYDDLISIGMTTGVSIADATFSAQVTMPGYADICGIPIPLGGVSTTGTLAMGIPSLTIDALISYTAAGCPKVTISNLGSGAATVDVKSLYIDAGILDAPAAYTDDARLAPDRAEQRHACTSSRAPSPVAAVARQWSALPLGLPRTVYPQRVPLTADPRGPV